MEKHYLFFREKEYIPTKFLLDTISSLNARMEDIYSDIDGAFSHAYAMAQKNSVYPTEEYLWKGAEIVSMHRMPLIHFDNQIQSYAKRLFPEEMDVLAIGMAFPKEYDGEKSVNGISGIVMECMKKSLSPHLGFWINRRGDFGDVYFCARFDYRKDRNIS